MKSLKRSFYEPLLHVIKIHQIQSILLGISGGPDSVALLHLLVDYCCCNSLCLSAAHVNFGLRGEDSNLDEAFVKKLCEKLKVPLHLHQVLTKDWELTPGTGTEEKARHIRYDFFNQLMESFGMDTLAVGHTQDDVLETLLFNMIRGTSPEKISHLMPFFDPDRRILRPLVPFSKTAILAYLEQEGQDYRTDTSNFTQRYSRNILRNQIIPLMEEINPQVSSAFFRFKDLVALEQDLISDSIKKLLFPPLWDNQLSKNGWLRVRRPLYLKLHHAYQLRLIREARQQVMGHTRHFYYPTIFSICQGIHQSVQFRYNDKSMKIWTRQNWVYFKKNDEEDKNVRD